MWMVVFISEGYRTFMAFRKIASIRTSEEFSDYIHYLGIDLPFDEQVLSGPDSPLAKPYLLKDGFIIGNRFCIQPMEGWDGSPEGKPSELTFRRWEHFGQSGAKLIWGCEAAAVQPDGRANPNQLVINSSNFLDFIKLRERLVNAHQSHYETDGDLLVGLQLTHSGRFCRPIDKKRLEPQILYHHPFLDKKFGLPDDYPLLTDAQIQAIIQSYIVAANLAQQAGFNFVDIKHCHGYLGHEFLSAYSRPGPYGGSFENRTRFLREIVQGIRSGTPGLHIGVRLSAFDTVPFKPGDAGAGVPETVGPYSYAFGVDANHLSQPRLDEAISFLQLLEALGIELVNLTAGSPYYNPHIQRPATFPPSDGYLPPEDPLVGVARQIQMTAELKKRFPDLLIVGSAYTYLQEWLPNVAQYTVRSGWTDFVGLGRMVLAYPEFPADVLAGRSLNRHSLCRTFSDCTTAPRHGLVSGCYPLDDYYKESASAELLKTLKSKKK
jgi:NADPH2 dehydrogenase